MKKIFIFNCLFLLTLSLLTGCASHSTGEKILLKRENLYQNPTAYRGDIQLAPSNYSNEKLGTIDPEELRPVVVKNAELLRAITNKPLSQNQDIKLPTKEKNLGGRLARVEDILKFHHPETEVESTKGYVSGKSELPEIAKNFLDGIISRCQSGDIISVDEIVGYADETPPPIGITNEQIGLNRANKIAAYLEAGGVNLSSTIVYYGGETDRYGEKKENRRTNIIYTKKK
jgi:outer membrane protein OmpA-like peptidoglycan-associated protein